MRRWLTRASLLAALALVLAACGGGLSEDQQPAAPASGDKKSITVKLASNDFTEQLILGEMYRQVLTKAGYTVDYKAKLGPREIVAPALESGQINMYIEYAGSARAILAKKTDKADEAKILEDLKAYYAPKNITPLEPAPMSDQNAFSVTKATADKYGSSLDQVATKAGELVVGGPPECEERVTCLKGVEDTYGAKFKDFRPIAQGALKYQALLKGDIDIALSFTTDGIIAKEGLVILEDPKGVFPPDNAIPVVRNDLLEQGGEEFRKTVNDLSARITTEEITKLNAKVDLDREDPEDVAVEWLTQQGLI
jgi:osmoprotectant transport system substrate-binding protein